MISAKLQMDTAQGGSSAGVAVTVAAEVTAAESTAKLG
jgi:hypothetical protein